MNPDNFSHILNVKVISIASHTIVNDCHLLEIIKDLFLNKDQYFNGVKLSWRRIEWTDLQKLFDIGDLVIDSVFSVDEMLSESVSKAFTEIKIELYNKKLMFNGQKIIFNLTKPLARRIPLVDTIGIII